MMYPRKDGDLESMPRDERPAEGWGWALNSLAMGLGAVMLLNYLLG